MAKNKINNFNSKVISLIIAIFIWGFVSLFVNPEITRKYNNIPVTIQNSEVLKDKDLELLTDITGKTINITIKGKRTSIAKTDKADITAYIDATAIKSGKKTYQIKYSLPYADLKVAQSNDEIKLEADKIIDKKVSVKLNKEGTNSNIRSVWLDDYTLTIKGISKFVKQVDKIEIDFNIDGIKASKKFSIGYKLVDKNGKVLDIKPNDIGLPETLTVNVSVR